MGLTIVLTAPLVTSAEDQTPPAAEEQPAQPDISVDPGADTVNPSIALKGSVWRTKPGIAFLKTPVGLLTLSSKTTFKDFRASQDVSFRIHGTHLLIDIRKRTDGSLVHRYLGGPITRSAGDENSLLRWTPEGEKSFHLGAYTQVVASRRDGDVVTVEVDDADTVIGLHDLQFDLQIGQLPASGSEARLLLTGTISKLKSNFIFFRTPIGVVNVNAKIGIRNAKVGQTMTLRIHEQHLIVDLANPNTTTTGRRFITGPLAFASSDREHVKLWTPDGEQVYSTDRGKTALAGAKEGSPITVELNGDGSVIGFHRPD
jgi:hypothetical protein